MSDAIMNLGQNPVNYYQTDIEKMRTKLEADNLNKALKMDGKEPVKELGKDEFLKLLITELQHQDPTNPMEDREFIAQMAQFSSLEQMLNMNTNMGKLLENTAFQSSFDLLGKNVDIEIPFGGEEGGTKVVSGSVESVSKKNTEVFIRVNGEEYPVNNILKVTN